MKVNVLVAHSGSIVAVQPLFKTREETEKAGEPVVEPVPADGQTSVQLDIEFPDEGADLSAEQLFKLVEAQLGE